MEPFVNVVLPVFTIILCGFVVGRFGLLGEASSEALNGFVYYVALPVLLFYSTARVEPADIFQWSYIVAFTAGSAATVVVAMIVSRFVFRCRLAEQAIFGMTAVFGNTGYMGIPLAIVAFGEPAALPAIIATILQSSVLLAVFAGLVEWDLSADRGGGNVFADVGGALIKNPLVLASVAGIAWSLSGLSLAAPVETFCKILSAAAGPSALFAIGLFLVGKPLRRGLSEVAVMTALKLVVHPLITWWLVVHVFDVTPVWAAVAVLMAALPAGANCFVLAQNYNIYVQRTSAAILISTVVAVATVSILFAMPVMSP
ncbi:MAG: AEC family transporter [Magnetovibrio sp.]|nr:AEC family transporter [Magnetovibrio sp.]